MKVYVDSADREGKVEEKLRINSVKLILVPPVGDGVVGVQKVERRDNAVKYCR